MKFNKRSNSTMNPFLSRKRKRKIKSRKKCKKIPGDFLCAKELGKEVLVCCAEFHGERRKEVTIENSLRGKHVGLLLARITNHGDLDWYLSSLKDVYDQLSRSKPNAFEIVFVPIFKLHPDSSYERCREMFDTLLMRMPWLSIPFEEVVWRNHLYKKYHVCDTSELLLFDNRPRRKLLDDSEALHALAIHYGAELYPFTRLRFLELQTQHLAPFQSSPSPSFEALLGSHLIYFDNHGVQQVRPTSHLQDKAVVGIYFYFGGIHMPRRKTSHLQFTNELEGYRTRSNGNFEIVFVNLDFHHGYKSEASFHDFLIKHPGLLALPFKDSKIRSLCRTLVAQCQDSLVTVQIFSVHGGDKKFFVDPYGACVINDYGFDAYPFTRDMAVKLQIKSLPTQFNLTDIFNETETKHLIHHSGNNRENEKTTKPVSFLVKNRVILYIKGCLDGPDQYVDDYKKLRDFQNKDQSLQVLFSSSPTSLIVPTNMPNKWLAFPSLEGSESIGEVINYEIWVGDFIAFDGTGKPLNIGQLGLLDHDDVFPFVSDEKFFRDLLMRTKEWDIEAECTPDT